MQRQAAQQASTQAYQAAETQRLNEVTPLEVAQKQQELQGRQGILSLSQNPTLINQTLSPMSESLGQTSKEEQAMLDSAKAQTVANLKQGKFDVTPYNQAVTKIAQDRMTQSRQLQETTPFKAWREQFMKQTGREPNAKEVQNFSTAGQALRITGMENLRQDNYLDTTAPGGALSTMTAGEFAQSNKQEPGRYVKPNLCTGFELRGEN